MLLVLMKVLWDLEIRVAMKGARREAIILEIIFSMTWIRLIGLK
jgi:hypothetical protein